MKHSKIRQRLFIIISIALLCSIESPCQEYHKLLDYNKSWSVYQWNSGMMGISYSTDIYSIYKDTVIGSEKYYQLGWKYDSTMIDFAPYMFFIREDTIHRKVYYYNKFEESEYVLYDFNLAQHDTIVINNYYHVQKLIANNIDSIFINDAFRRQIHFKVEEDYDDPESSEKWIEGIGSTSGLTQVALNYGLIDGGTKLLCVHQNNSLIYRDSTFSSCYESTVNTQDITQEPSHVIVLSDPLTFQFNNIRTHSSRIQIYDLRGINLISIKLDGEQSLAVPIRLLQGIYIYSFRNKETLITGKFMVSGGM